MNITYNVIYGDTDSVFTAVKIYFDNNIIVDKKSL